MKQRHLKRVQRFLASVSIFAIVSLLVPVQLVMAATVTIVTGQVTYPGGTAASGVTVEVHTPDGVFSTNTLSNASGNYTLSADSSQLTTDMSLVLEIQAPTGYNKPSNSPTNFTWTGTQYTTTNFELVAALKTITGSVLLENGQAAPQTEVRAYPVEFGKSMASTNTAVDGSYTMNVQGGKWTVKADINLGNHNSTHLVTDIAKQVEFADDSTQETESGVNFTATATTASVTARFLNSDGSELTTSSFRADISIFRDDGTGTVRKVDENSTLTNIGLVPGVYRMKAFHSDLQGKTFDPDDVTFVLKEGDTVDLGTIQATEMDKTITGTLTKSGVNERVSNQFITATNTATKERVNAQTDSNGVFSLTVGEGTWTIGLEVKQDTPFRFTTPSTVILGESDSTASVDLVVEAMDQTMTGSVTDEDGAVLENFVGNVVVEDPISGEMFTAPIDSDGMYTVDIPRSLSGRTVNVGVQGAPDSDYGMTDFTTAVVADTTSKTLELQADNSTISGELKDPDGNTLTTEANEVIVVAVNEMGQIEKATVGTNGQYFLDVTSGDWNVSFQVQADDSTFLDPVASGVSVSVAEGEIGNAHMTVLEKDATVAGTVTDNTGAVVPLAPVVITNRPQLEAAGEAFDIEDMVQVVVEADENGAYSADVPAGDYTVLAGMTPDVADLVQPTGVNVTVATGGTESADLQFGESDFELSGMLDQGTDDFIADEGVHVAAFTDSGKFVEAATTDLGEYSLALEKGETWKLVATYLDGATLLMSDVTEYTPASDASTDEANISVSDSGIEVPGSVTKSFDASATASVALPDGGTVQLSPFAAGESGEITLTVTPTVDLKPSATGSPVSILYDVNVQNDDGVDVQKLNVPAKVTLPYNSDVLGAANIEEGNTYIQFFGENSDVWQGAGMAAIVNSEDQTVTAYTTHLTPFAINGAPSAVQQSESPSLPSGTPTEEHILLTPESAGGPNVRVVEESGDQVETFFAYGETLRGGFMSQGADIDGDGTNEVVTVAGQGFGPHLRAFEPDGTFIDDEFTSDASSRVGLTMAVGDVNGNGTDDVIVAKLAGGDSTIRVYQFDTRTDEWATPLDDQLVFDEGYTSGVQLLTFDMDGDGAKEIAVSPTIGSGNVQVFSLADGELARDTWFWAYGNPFSGGVNMVSADIDGDGTDELFTIPRSAAPTLRYWNYEDGGFVNKAEVTVYQDTFLGGVTLAAGDADGDGNQEITVAPLTRGGANIRTYTVADDTFDLSDWFMAYDANYRGGMHTAMADVDADGDDDLVVAADMGHTPNVRVYSMTDGEWELLDWFWGFANTFKGGVNLGTL
ncbi:MAG: VCBS repeat-containing protein [Candidatus Kerfeldbacteria bacterium]|nr:VCBS repeat-containing protein [Candidatus Kerfeldbacteria bacterium]